MKRIFIILLLGLTFVQNGIAQDDFAPEYSDVKNRINLKIMPLSLVHPMHHVRFGLEFISKKKLGFGVDVGIGNQGTFELPFRPDMLFSSTTWGRDYEYFEIKPEVKHLIVNKERFFLYSALELFYMQMGTTMKNNKFEEKETELIFAYDQAELSRKEYGFHAKIGFNLIAGPFNFDFFGGIGLAKRKIDYSNIVNPQKYDYEYHDEWFTPYLHEQNRNVLHFTLGFKIGYTLIEY